MDTAKEWERLHARYAAMGDLELMELRNDFESLTELAKGVLRDELLKRKLPEPRKPDDAPEPDGPSSLSRLDILSDEDDVDGEDPEIVRSYTWKTTLRTFESPEDAWMASEALKEADIENWLQVPRNAMDPTTPRVQVAADDLERAIAVLANPIPDRIRSAASAKIEDFEPPQCPRCHAADPILESADPANQWSCEACGHTWQDEIELPE